MMANHAICNGHQRAAAFRDLDQPRSTTTAKDNGKRMLARKALRSTETAQDHARSAATSFPRVILSGVSHKTVLVKGGAGFIGSLVADALVLERGDGVVVVDNMNDYKSFQVKEENLAIFSDHPKASVSSLKI
jgi:FlaA1/EpsC-like NDP-sugar epimerase